MRREREEGFRPTGRGKTGLRPFLKLARVSLTPTALADSTAGFFFAASTLETRRLSDSVPLDLLTVGAISILTYWTGMVTNDLFDLQKDRVRHPHRPLPMGAVKVPEAISMAAMLILFALLLAYRIRVLPILLVLICAVFAYNGGGKRIPILGNLLMGSCRSLNFLLGAAAILPEQGFVDSLGPFLAAAAFPGVYIALLTAVSLLEDRPYRLTSIGRLLLVLMGVPLALLLWGWRFPGAWVNSLVLIGLLGRQLRLPPPESVAEGHPHPAEKVVRAGLSGVYFVNAGLLWSRNLVVPALGMYGLFVLGWLFQRGSQRRTGNLMPRP